MSEEHTMIILTKLGGKEILINENQIESAQETPDTVIMMNNGHTYIVAEPLSEIIGKTIQFTKGIAPETKPKA